MQRKLSHPNMHKITLEQIERCTIFLASKTEYHKDDNLP